jgi:pantothenate kinase
MEAPVLISLGKMNASEHNENHVVNSLFKMVAYNLAQLALMYSNIQNVDRLVFTGFFCRNNTFMIDCFGQAFRFFSK